MPAQPSDCTESPNIQMPTAVTPDGRSLIFTEAAAITGGDVMQLTLDGPRTVTPLVKTAFSERNGIVSPDGQWLAYEANDSGRFEIFVVPFPEVGSGRWHGVHGRRHAPTLGAQWARAVLCFPDGCGDARRG